MEGKNVKSSTDGGADLRHRTISWISIYGADKNNVDPALIACSRAKVTGKSSINIAGWCSARQVGPIQVQFIYIINPAVLQRE